MCGGVMGRWCSRLDPVRAGREARHRLPCGRRCAWQVPLLQGGSQTGGKLDPFFGRVGRLLPRIQSVVVVSWKDMQVVVPDILVAGGSIVLTGGDSIALKNA